MAVRRKSSPGLSQIRRAVRKELARVRATAMEGSFGTQKEHYDLRRVKARTKLTEILYIFFGTIRQTWCR